MESRPTDEELKKRYNDVMEDEGVSAICNWKVKNTDEIFDVDKYLDNIDQYGDTIAIQFGESAERIGIDKEKRKEH